MHFSIPPGRSTGRLRGTVKLAVATSFAFAATAEAQPLPLTDDVQVNGITVGPDGSFLGR